MDSSILEKLFFGQISPIEVTMPKNGEYARAMRRYEKKWDEFEPHLRRQSEEFIRLYDELTGSHSLLMIRQSMEYFNLGFRLGVQLTAAAYSDDRFDCEEN